MIIGFVGLNLPEGKMKFKDPRFDALVEKHKPKKLVPHYVELMKGDLSKCDGIIVERESILDLILPDIERCEQRMEKSEDQSEKALLQKSIKFLEEEKLLCDAEFNDEEKKLLLNLNFITMKPVVPVNASIQPEEAVKAVIAKAGIVFFFTAGPPEVHAWPVHKSFNIVECAEKIHSDLARGFIRADIVSFDDYMKVHSFNDAKKQGLAKVVDRDYIINDGDIIEIRFNVS